MYLAFIAALSAPGYWLCWRLMTLPYPFAIADRPLTPALIEPDAHITLDSDVRGLV